MAIALVYHKNPKSNCFTDLKVATFDMTHAGQESYCFGVSNGRYLETRNGAGIIDLTSDYGGLSGFMGVGRNSSKPGAEPVFSYSPKLGNFALAFDGYIINGDKLREKWGGKTDAELAARFIADANNFVGGVENLSDEVKGHFCITVATEKGEGYATRCKFGVRPLVYGSGEKGHALVSESRALSHIDMEIVRDIIPGEIAAVDSSGLHPIKQIASITHVCSFLFPYFQMADCITEGVPVALVKERIGAVLGRMDKDSGLEVDVAIPVPDSGKDYEASYASVLGCEHEEILKKYGPAGRSYERPGQGFRDLIAGVKMTVIDYKAKGKRIVVLDDSTRRGTQIVRPKGPIDLLKRAGARKIHLRFCSPRNIKYCRCSPPEGGHYRDDELAANRYPTDEVLAEHLGVNSVKFIMLDPFVDCIIQGSKLEREQLCLGCYTGGFGFLE